MKKIMLPVFIILAAALTPIFGKLSVAEISPLSFGFLRFGTAAVLFYITIKIRKINLKFDKKDYPLLLFLSFLCIPINQFFFLTGIKMTYASHSGIIYSLNPVYAYVAAVLMKNEKFYYSKLIAILLTVAGVFFVFYEGFSKTSGNNILTGDILLLFAVLSFSLYLTIGKKIIDKYGALKVSAFIFVTGSIMYIPLFIYDLPNLTFANLTYKGIIGFIFLSVVVAYLAYFAWYYALKTIKVSKLTTLSNISPLITVLFSIIFLGETVSVYFIIGAVIALIGVFMMHRVSIELS
jgi:drug/metabolite transporter (DMT)-like permease